MLDVEFRPLYPTVLSSNVHECDSRDPLGPCRHGFTSFLSSSFSLVAMMRKCRSIVCETLFRKSPTGSIVLTFLFWHGSRCTWRREVKLLHFLYTYRTCGSFCQPFFAPGHRRVLSSTMSGHGHRHGHGCGCEGEHEPSERGLEYGLYRRIDLEKLQCLNESRDGDGKLVFKPWDQRNERDKVTAVPSPSPGHLIMSVSPVA